MLVKSFECWLNFPGLLCLAGKNDMKVLRISDPPFFQQNKGKFPAKQKCCRVLQHYELSNILLKKLCCKNYKIFNYV